MSYKPYNSDNAVFYVNILVFSSLVKALVETFAWILSSSSVIMFCDRLLLNITWAVVTAVLRNPLQHLTVYSSQKSILVLAETILDVKLRKPARTIITDTASVQSTKKMTPRGVARELRIYTPGNTFFFPLATTSIFGNNDDGDLNGQQTQDPPQSSIALTTPLHISVHSLLPWEWLYYLWKDAATEAGLSKCGTITTYRVYETYMELNMELNMGLSPHTKYMEHTWS